MITNYKIKNEKIAGCLKLAVFSDLHCHVYKPDNLRLIDAVIRMEPDCILMSGDMITSRDEDGYVGVAKLLAELVKIAPVYYSIGNHEGRIKHFFSIHSMVYLKYEKMIKSFGVNVLDNTYSDMTENVRIYGLTIPQECYQKGRSVPLPENFIYNTFGYADESRLNLMLAHNPSYVKEYAKWGADVSFGGHNHGGMVRLPGVGSILSPQFEFFPKYDRGCYEIEGRHAVVSAGLGDHSVKLRINNPPELISLTIN